MMGSQEGFLEAMISKWNLKAEEEPAGLGRTRQRECSKQKT